MAKDFHISKTFAIVTVVLTVSAIAGVIIMAIIYQSQISELNPSPRPTFLPTTEFPTAPPPDMRLPGDLVPESYRLFLQPHLYTSITEAANLTSPNQTMVFTGNSTVDLRCVRRTRSIFLHSKNLALLVWKVTNKDTDKEVKVTDVKFYKDETDFLEIQLSDILTEGGNYSLFLAFEGEMTDDLAGLYMSKYNEGVSANGSNTERFLATSQLQPTEARKVFPCFDEPALKATFDVTVIHRRLTTALGNWEVSESNVLDEEWMYTHFYPTRKMSTYLLAFVVSEFKSISSTHDRVTITTHARREALEAGHAAYANNITGKILKFFEDRFDIKFPLQKLDQIALPDFAAAGMENWGLIMYSETALLYDPKASSLFDKEWIAEVVAHELAHQWFGNLVTMRWWNDVWLNEGFANYMSKLAVDHIEPDWNIKDMLMVRQLHSAFEMDSLAMSRPLSPPPGDIQTPDQIASMFDGITYNKGAAVLTMVADLVKEEVFNEGVKMYLNAFQYNNTENKDLWHSLEKAVYENGGSLKVAEMMNTWTQQRGFPVVTINTTTGEVHQQHFTFNQSAQTGQVWQIPIKVMTWSHKHDEFMLKTQTATRDSLISKGGEWILANVNCTGFFRVNYDQNNWRSLMDQMERNPSRIPVMNRGQLINDVFDLVRAKLVNVTLALNSTRFLRNDTADIPWASAVANLQYFEDMFYRSEVYGPMQEYLRKQVRGVYNYFRNYTDNSEVPLDHSQQHSQRNSVNVACTNGLPECEAMAKRMFENWMENETNNSIHANLRPTIYCTAVAVGGYKEWEFAWKMYQKSTVAAEKNMLCHALSCTNKIWLLNRYLEYTLDPSKIRKMDAVSTIISVARNAAGQALAWNFVRAHWTYISEDYGAGLMALGHLIQGVTQTFSTDFELKELRRFQSEHGDEVQRAVEQAIELTQSNIMWVQENKQIVLEWFLGELAS